jgi:hypothetical protein
MNRPIRIGFCATFLLSTACQTPAILRTARTLPEGEGDISLAVNVTRLSVDEQTVGNVTTPSASFTYPNLVPEILYNYGLSNDFEFGGKISLGSGLLEANVKYRYLQSEDGKLHMAAAPAIGYRAIGLVDGPVFTLPLLFTYDVAPLISVSGGPLASYAIYNVNDSLETDEADISGDTLFVGAGIGLEMRTRQGFHIMPTIEYQRSVSRSLDDEFDGEVPALNVLFIGVTLGWGPRQRTLPAAEAAPAE